MQKSTPQEIRQRFDQDVERFANLATGQSATIDAPLVLELISDAAAAVTPRARSVLDVGCGAGNYTLKLLERLPNFNSTLIDLSKPMLDRAVQRLQEAGAASVTPMQGDIRELPLPAGGFDIVMAAAVLHHLREESEWEAVFAKFYQSLRPGGSIWIADLVRQHDPAIQAMMWRRYGQFLTGVKNEQYRDEIFAYIEVEDSPRPVTYQLDLLRKVGFAEVEILHKNSCFAAFGAVKR